jgi:hypothetical protein
VRPQQHWALTPDLEIGRTRFLADNNENVKVDPSKEDRIGVCAGVDVLLASKENVSPLSSVNSFSLQPNAIGVGPTLN